MIEAGETQSPSGPAESQAAQTGPSAGALLRAAREAAGLHVGALAVALKVPVRKLEALEADQYDLLTDAVFVRALASSVCRTLKIDPQPVLERLPQMTAPRLVSTSERINMPFRAPGDGAPPTWLDQLTRPVFLAVFALLLGALVLILLPKAQQESVATAAKSAVSQASSPAPAQPATSLPAPGDAVTAVVSPLVPTAAAVAAVPTLAAASNARPAASSSAVLPATVSVAAVVPAAPASGLIVFRAKGPSWVEVVDAKGVVAVRKVLEAGEAAGASGALPLRVTIGRIDATEVQVRGKPFDLQRVSRDNVARFEVN
jgi:cytoskeleton protein RodZ